MSSPWLRTGDNYYAVLELLSVDVRSVQPLEIKKAYRKMALLFHPDKGHKGGDILFQRVQESYEVLNDSLLRRDYHEWHWQKFRSYGVTLTMLDKEAAKRQRIIDGIVGQEERERKQQEKEQRGREQEERRAAEAQRKKKEARDRSRERKKRKAEARRAEAARLAELERKQKEQLQKQKDIEMREKSVFERRRQEERQRAEERSKRVEEEQLRKESARGQLSKADYFKRLSEIQEQSQAMAAERDMITEESERVAKRSEIIRASAEAAFAKAKKKYEDSLKKSKAQLEKAFAMDAESDAIHAELVDMLDEYADLTDAYGPSFGYPEAEAEEEDDTAETEDDPLEFTNAHVDAEIPSSFDTPKSSPHTGKPMSAHEYIKTNGSPLNQSSNPTPTKHNPTSSHKPQFHASVPMRTSPEADYTPQTSQPSTPVSGRKHARARARKTPNSVSGASSHGVPQSTFTFTFQGPGTWSSPASKGHEDP